MPYSKYQLLAWSIEWEGTICLSYNGNSTHNGKKTPSILPKLEILQKNRILLEKMRKIFPYGKIEPNRQYWQWRVSKQEDLSVILPKILPHLITKKKQAKIVLAYVTHRQLSHHRKLNKIDWNFINEYRRCVGNVSIYSERIETTNR